MAGIGVSLAFLVLLWGGWRLYRMGKQNERTKAYEKLLRIQKKQMEAALKRPHNRDELARRLRDQNF